MVLVLEAVRVAGEVAVFQLLLLLRIRFAADDAVVEALAVEALVHDDGVFAVVGGAEDVGADV